MHGLLLPNVTKWQEYENSPHRTDARQKGPGDGSELFSTPEYNEARKNAGCEPYDQECDAALENWKTVLGVIANEPAYGLPGLAVKVRILVGDVLDGLTCHSNRLANSVAADLDRLAGAS